MNNKELYKYRFDELLMIFKRNRHVVKTGKGEMKSNWLIDISGDAFRTYSRIVDNNESWVIYTIECLSRNLLQVYGIEYEVPEYEEIDSKARNRKIHPFAFAKVEDGKKIGYIFRYTQNNGLNEIHKRLEKYKDIDGVKYYFIKLETERNIEILNDIENVDYNGFVKFGILKEFFESEFGKEEYETFILEVERFNAEARNLIGLATVEMPTDKIVDSFKEERACIIKEFNYSKLIPSGISKTQREIIARNFIDKERYKLLLADSDKCNFADSFIGSEWYYNQSFTTGVLEQTAIVVGYLKSVEQLLYVMLRFWINSNKWIKINGKYEDSFKGINHGNGLIDFTETNEEYIDKTLGALIRFIKLKNRNNEFKNKNMFCVNQTSLQCIIDVLYNFKDLERNDRLHQHNLYTREAVEEIREQAWLLYFLLLGSFNVSDKYISRLATDNKKQEKSVIEDKVLYERIREWASPVIKYDLPINTDIIAFNVVKFQGKPWGLGIEALKAEARNKYDTYEWNHHKTYTSYITNNILEWQSEESFESGMEKIERLLLKYVEEDSIMIDRLRNCTEVVVGTRKVDRVLYKKYKE